MKSSDTVMKIVLDETYFKLSSYVNRHIIFRNGNWWVESYLQIKLGLQLHASNFKDFYSMQNGDMNILKVPFVIF